MKTIFAILPVCALLVTDAVAQDRIIPSIDDLGGRLYEAHDEGTCFYQVVNKLGYQCQSRGGAGSVVGYSAMATRRYTVEGIQESEMEGFLKKLIAEHAKEVTECGARVLSQFVGKMREQVCFGSIRFITRDGQPNEERGMIEISLFAAGGDKCFAIVVYHVAPNPPVGNGPHNQPDDGGADADDRSPQQTDGPAIPPPASGGANPQPTSSSDQSAQSTKPDAPACAPAHETSTDKPGQASPQVPDPPPKLQAP